MPAPVGHHPVHIREAAYEGELEKRRVVHRSETGDRLKAADRVQRGAPDDDGAREREWIADPQHRSRGRAGRVVEESGAPKTPRESRIGNRGPGHLRSRDDPGASIGQDDGRIVELRDEQVELLRRPEIVALQDRHKIPTRLA